MCYALGDISASASALYASLQPPTTAVFAYFWQGETIGPLMIGSALLGMVGVFLTSYFSAEAAPECSKRPCIAGSKRNSKFAGDDADGSDFKPLTNPLLDADAQERCPR